MKFEIVPKAKEKRKISTCKNGEAFCFNGSWYIVINITDTGIGGFDDFFQLHCIHDGPHSDDYGKYITAMHIGSQGFCYVYGDIEPEEWADVKLALTLK